MRRALQQLRSNQEFVPLSVSALARSRADWLYGMNMTRAYTLRGQQAGYSGCCRLAGYRPRYWGWWFGGIRA
ncbi:hypothetical protein [Aliamphritea spongicola]|nr:hypothetical protein [Aliamphritea spongicola]